MNYYNPYYSIAPYLNGAPKVGLLSRIFGGSGLSFSSILTGTQKTLNIINQTIPIVKQASPVIKNAKTMFRVMNEFKKVDNPIESTSDKVESVVEEQSNYNNSPTFFA